MKKVIVLLLATCLLINLVACSSSGITIGEFEWELDQTFKVENTGRKTTFSANFDNVKVNGSADKDGNVKSITMSYHNLETERLSNKENILELVTDFNWTMAEIDEAGCVADFMQLCNLVGLKMDRWESIEDCVGAFVTGKTISANGWTASVKIKASENSVDLIFKYK